MYSQTTGWNREIHVGTAAPLGMSDGRHGEHWFCASSRLGQVDRLAMIDSTKSVDILKALAAPAPAPMPRAPEPKLKEPSKANGAPSSAQTAPLDQGRY